MSAAIIPLPTPEDLHDAYVRLAAAFRDDPRHDRIGAVLDAYRAFHRVVWLQYDIEIAARGVRRKMLDEIEKKRSVA